MHALHDRSLVHAPSLPPSLANARQSLLSLNEVAAKKERARVWQLRLARRAHRSAVRHSLTNSCDSGTAKWPQTACAVFKLGASLR